jgi:hypothetical protein
MNPWEQKLLDVLANHVRFLAVAQLARASFAGQRLSGRRAVQAALTLVDSGWLRLARVFARPIQSLSEPLCQWRHMEPVPDFAVLSRRLHQRASLSAALTTIMSATAKTCTLFGATRSSAARIKLTQTTHDLQVAEVFLHYVARGFPWGVHWAGEDVLPETWPIRQRPDALLVDDAGQYVRAVEYGGDYSEERLIDLHLGLSSLPLSYEIW